MMPQWCAYAMSVYPHDKMRSKMGRMDTSALYMGVYIYLYNNGPKKKAKTGPTVIMIPTILKNQIMFTKDIVPRILSMKLVLLSRSSRRVSTASSS